MKTIERKRDEEPARKRVLERRWKVIRRNGAVIHRPHPWAVMGQFKKEIANAA